MELSHLKNVINENMATREAAKKGLKLQFYDRWKPELDEALHGLPESDICSHELFSMICQSPSSSVKRIVLIIENGEPIAVACFRRMDEYWVPVTHYVVPGYLFPVKEGYIARALEAVGFDIHIAWWRWQVPPPESTMVKDVHSAPTHGVSLSEDFEAYWREVGQFKNVRKYRNRCKDFDFTVNKLGMAEWTIRNWEAKWRPHGIAVMPDLEERLIVAQYLERLGLCHTLALFDKEEPVASALLLIHRRDAVAYVNYRKPEYDWNGAMNRLIDLCFYWAKDMGFDNIDIGGSIDYKDKWAPENGQKWEFIVCPTHVATIGKVMRMAESGWDMIKCSHQPVSKQ